MIQRNGSNAIIRNSSGSQQQGNYFMLKVLRFILYTLGALSLILVLFMAQRLESRYGRFEPRILDFDRRAGSRRASIHQNHKSFKSKQQTAENTSAPHTDESRVLPEHEKKQDEPMKAKHPTQTPKVVNDYIADVKAVTEDTVDARLVDARLADIPMDIKIEEANGGSDQHSIVSNKASKHNSNEKDVVPASVADANVLVVIISNRRDGIIPTLASIITTSSKPVDVVLIGEHAINEQVNAHFGSRINEFKSMSVKDIEDDLVAQGIQPIWTWPDWHTSMDPGWKNENTLHVGTWDNLHTHAHELNHLRFYLPHVSVFKDKGYFYFLDDDILVQKDLGVLAEKTMDDLNDKHGLVCPCNIWMWNSECFHFEFQSKKDYILSMPSLYGDREVCKTDAESHCVPPNYWDFVDSVMPEGGKDQHAWNFGFSLFALENWRNLKLTEKYETVMKASYEKHVFPETSLTFGLGVSYIAFAGNVECWNEDYVQVRDGFGFIEWDRYARTFGKDFFDSVDVVHFTGPDKPWVNESRIEERAIVPWLNLMEQEKMPMPKQLPLEPTENLFTVLASDRTGAQWMMSTLDGHPHVCASGEADKPETGFPADVLLPSGLPWYPYCSIKRGCTYEFVLDSVKSLLSNMTDATTPFRCAKDYDAEQNSDLLVEHLERLCAFVKTLDGNIEESNIAKVYIDAFVREDRTLLGCGCVRGVKAKGLKVMAEWIIPKDYPHDLSAAPFINLNSTKVHGNKIIRLKRRNLWARYKSMMIAQSTGVFHPTNPGEKKSQLEVVQDLTIEFEHLEWNIKNMAAIDRAGDEWAREHASEVLWLDYEDCRSDTADCYTKIYDFLGVDSSHVTGKQAHTYESLFAEFAESDATMDHIANARMITELMGVNGWDHYITDNKYKPIQFLTYEENNLLVDSRSYMGLESSMYGQDPAAEGHGSRYKAALPLLKTMSADSLVVLNSDRDGHVNFPVGDHQMVFDFLFRFRSKFNELTEHHQGAVVVSTESNCCASALTHVSPGDYFDENGNRNVRSCTSGTTECQWNGDDKAIPWQSFMKRLASERSKNPSEYVYLDTSFIAGKAVDLIQLIETIDIQAGEDDRAILTDYMYRKPEMVLLDYNQIIFGDSRKPLNKQVLNQCFVEVDSVTSEARRLDIVETAEQPLFISLPRNLGCGDAAKSVSPKYPIWDEDGIVLKPLLDHIDRVADMKESIVLPPMYGRKPDYSQGPEVLYVFDKDGLWTSNLIRDRTNNVTMDWRMKPTEGLVRLAHNMLMEEDSESERWTALRRTLGSGGFPYFAWYGDFKTCNTRNYDKESIPLFTTCAMANCTHAFPMPNYMTIIDSQSTSENWRGVFNQFQSEHPWESKLRQVAWRGSLSEAEWRNALSSVRWRVAKLVHDEPSHLYDVGLTSIPSWLTDKIDFNMTEIGEFAGGISPMTTFMQYQAVLDMDGNSWSSRFGSLLCYNSVVIKIEPRYFEYFYSDLIPWEHYIPIKDDLSDFQQNIEWALDPKNEASVKGIISAANQWCSQRLSPPELAVDTLDIMESYVRLLDKSNTDWQGDWQQRRDQLFSSSKLDMAKVTV